MFVSHPLIKENKIEKRAYQETIAELAEGHNTLVVMPTALGKTVIAILLSARSLERYPLKKVLIMAPTRPLAAQHAKSARDFLRIDESKVALLTGHTPPSKRDEMWRDSKVICATPHVILNDLRAGRYLPGELSLAVFDEAHRAVGDYTYTAIAPMLDCRILALTASPGGRDENIQEVSTNLRIENVEIRDEKDGDVAPYVKGFEISWKKIVLPEPYLVIRNLLSELLRERLSVLRRERLIKGPSSKVTKKELLALMNGIRKNIARGGHSDLYGSMSAVSGSLIIAHALDLLETQGVGPLSSYLRRTEEKAASPGASKALKKLSASRDFKRVVAISETLRNRGPDPKIRALKEIISGRKKGMKIIVFTQYRDTAVEVASALNEIEGVKAVRFVGQANKKGDPGLSQREQLEVIRGFSEGDFNVLVATSVAEEGLDIPAVDLVIFFEPVPSEIRAIQRRGRTGRSKIGEVVVLMAEKTRDEGIYWSSVARERRMKRNLRALKHAGEHSKSSEDIRSWS